MLALIPRLNRKRCDSLTSVGPWDFLAVLRRPHIDEIIKPLPKRNHNNNHHRHHHFHYRQRYTPLFFSRTPALQINKDAYTRALYKAVTLETGLVWAYRADTDDNRHHHQRRQGGAFPRATLRAFSSESLDPPAAGDAAGTPSDAGQRHSSTAAAAQLHSQPSTCLLYTSPSPRD